MAALIEEARERRDLAVRLRMRAVGLRLSARQIARTSRGRVVQANAECARLRAALEGPQPSPWSDLDWLRDDESLEQTFVPLP